MRKICALVVAVVVGALSLLGAGSAVAEPQLPRIVQYSENIGTFGDHDYCRGAFNVGLVAPKGSRGVVRVTLRSLGFSGTGPGWRRDPNCRFLADLEFTNGRAFMKQKYVPVSFGSRPGQTVVRHLRTGPGAVQIRVSPLAINNPAHPVQGYGAAFYTVVP